ncbi:MAG: HIT domain-containing protein [archaeon]|nr:HIT domain-containing protein [archaeon]
MALTPQQIKELKSQLYNQIAHLPPEQKKAAQAQIDSLSPEALEAMIEQQKEKSPKSKAPEKPIFRKIIDKETPSVIIDESLNALAVLDIFPISHGHTIIIPKKPILSPKDLPTQTLALAKKIAKRISSKLKAKSIQILTETKFGETIINVLPSYENPVDLSASRSQSSPEHLESIAKKLRPIKKKSSSKPKQDLLTQILTLPRRIP